MKARNLMLVSLVVVAGSVVAATAQSLAEVAKKEKERRDKNRTEATRVITERELQRSYGGLPATSSTVTGALAGESGGGPESPEGEAEPAAQDETQTREYWQNRLNAAREKIASLEKRLADENWGEGQRVGVDPRGQNNLVQRQEAERQLMAARAELQAIQAEARRAAVPPGWIR